MKRNICVNIFIVFIASVLTGCATTGPGPFSGGNYQQIVLNPQESVKQVTVLRLAPDSQKKMIQTPGTVVIGKSVFHIDSDELDNQTLEAQAESQAKDVDANVVLLSQCYLGDETKTKTVEKKSAFQEAAEEIPLVVGGESYDKHSGSTKQTQYTPTGRQSTTKKHSSSLGVGGIATLGELTALIPGNVIDETVKYQAKVYEIHAIFLRTSNYPGL
jgi:hypothetical protein